MNGFYAGFPIEQPPRLLNQHKKENEAQDQRSKLHNWTNCQSLVPQLYAT